MSKIGRRPINISGVQVEVKGQAVHYKGSKATGEHTLPHELQAQMKDTTLVISPTQDKATLSKKNQSDVNRLWGLHRALLANKIRGAAQEFEQQVQISGLGYKAAVSGSKAIFTLGYSHKIDFPIPKGVTIAVDKTGQLLTVKAADKFLVGQVCSNIKSLRRPEPYKGTGIKLSSEEIRRKAGKAKATAG